MDKKNTNKIGSIYQAVFTPAARVKHTRSGNGMSEFSILESLANKFSNTDNAIRTASLSDNKKAKPFIQWVGGKREMITQYQDYIPKKFNSYFEPFLGGGALFFHLAPNKAFLADSNLELVKTYEGVRDDVDTVINHLRLLKSKHSKELYLAIRNLDRVYNIFADFSNPEIAARFIYLNQTGFNGVYRVNQKGQYNVPIGSSLNRLICDENTLRKASEILKSTDLKCIDFEEFVKDAKKDDFVYFDPPYFPISIYSDFTRYTKEKFYKEDQIRLKEAIDKLTRKGCKVMLSNSDCEFIQDLYSDYKKIKVCSNRTLNCKSDRRGKVSELLIINYKV